MYYKRCTGCLLVKSIPASPCWVQWTHHSEGKTHCEECLRLDGCWFLEENAPPCLHHLFCHCTLEPIEYTSVLKNASTRSAYGKFDPFLFNTTGLYTHGKEVLFKKWGYSVDDIPWLKAEMERQALQHYLSGNYTLGKLDKNGQRINIRISLVRRDTGAEVTFVTGWMAKPNGTLVMATPYGDE